VSWTLVVLAAGLGSRYGGTKQLEAVGPSGETLADYTIWDARNAGAVAAIFVVREGHEAVFRTHHARWAERLPIRYAHQRLDDLPPSFEVPPGRTRPWGTTQAVLAAARMLNGPFAVANADDCYGADALQSIGRFLEAPDAGAALVTFPLRETLSPHGGVSRALVDSDATGFLTRIREVHDIEAGPGVRTTLTVTGRRGAVPVALRGDEPVSMNLWGFTQLAVRPLRNAMTAFLVDQGTSTTAECQLPVAVNVLVEHDAVRVRVLSGGTGWVGLTHAEDRVGTEAAIRDLVVRGVYPTNLFA
jgi:hypothetical protein